MEPKSALRVFDDSVERFVIFSLASRRGCKSAITCSLTRRRSSYHGNLEGASPTHVFGIREIAKAQAAAWSRSVAYRLCAYGLDRTLPCGAPRLRDGYFLACGHRSGGGFCVWCKQSTHDFPRLFFAQYFLWQFTST